MLRSWMWKVFHNSTIFSFFLFSSNLYILSSPIRPDSKFYFPCNFLVIFFFWVSFLLTPFRFECGWSIFLQHKITFFAWFVECAEKHRKKENIHEDSKLTRKVVGMKHLQKKRNLSKKNLYSPNKTKNHCVKSDKKYVFRSSYSRLFAQETLFMSTVWKSFMLEGVFEASYCGQACRTSRRVSLHHMWEGLLLAQFVNDSHLYVS
jgi:hypothetical protein